MTVLSTSCICCKGPEPEEKPMKTTDGVKQDLLEYFGAIDAAPGHRFSMRDFNQQVMMNVFAPAERDCLDLALRELVEAQILEQVAETEYVLGPQGRSLVVELRRARLPSGLLKGNGETRRPRPTSSRPWTTARVVDASSL
jgi:hypothetical protein